MTDYTTGISNAGGDVPEGWNEIAAANSAALAIDMAERARRNVIVAAIAWRCVPDRRDQDGIDTVLADAIDRLLALAPE